MMGDAEKLAQIAEEMRALLSHGGDSILAANEFESGQNSIASRVLYIITDGEEG
jgi:hypothetical protein